MDFSKLVDMTMSRIDKEMEEDDDGYTIWLTTIRSIGLYINYDCYSNNEPLFMTYDEIKDAISRKIKIKDVDEVEQIFDEDRDEIICKLNEKGIAFEYAYMKLNERVQEEFRSFFEHGQYTKYAYLTMTSRRCTSNAALNRLIKGYNKGAQDTGYHNLGIVLNIPRQCFDTANPWPLYKYTDSMTLGTYMNVEEVRKVIPREYIKEGVYKCGKNIIKFSNPYFNKDYILHHSDDKNLYDGESNKHYRNR